MPQPTSTYSFRATPQDTDYVRICKENHQARIIVVKSEKLPPITLVRQYSAENNRLRALGLVPTAKVDTLTRSYLLFEGDVHAKALPLITTCVETY